MQKPYFLNNFILLTIIMARFCGISGFLTRNSPDWRTKTHLDITNSGSLQAISTYIFQEKLANATSEARALDEFFHTDHTGKTKVFKAVGAIRTSVADTQEEKSSIAYVHCHADQLQLAHKHVIACENKLLERKDDLEELRRQIGECLYTVQSFYSNTNWVEMFGRNPYLDFGVKNTTLMDVATAAEDTCKDVADPNSHCIDNILVSSKLTSGFYHGRGNTKQAKSKGSKTGKCSHGGIHDESRLLIARCGINKETTLEHLSPHYHLHNDAYYAAVAATKNFLIGKDTGILDLLGKEIFDNIFHIKKRKQVSLAFAVDYSGSMGLEIKQVKERIVQIVTSTIGSENEPADYVLSLFNDPANLNKGFRYSDGYKLIEEVSKIVVQGGGDCPELAAAGIIKAIELCKNDSTIYVFTDADAKDQNRESELVTAAKAKNIKVSTLRTGKCYKRRRRRLSDYSLRKTNFFDAVAVTTGGKVYDTSKDGVGTVLDEIMQDSFPTSEINIEFYKWRKSEGLLREVYVDESIQVLKISIKEASSLDNVDFIHINGTTESFTSASATRIFTDSKEIIMTLQKLPPGKYMLRKNVLHEDWWVNITVQSSVSVEIDILEKTVNGALLSVASYPVTGNNYTFTMTVFNFENGTCDSISMIGDDRIVVSDLKAHQIISDIDVLCLIDIVLPNYAFQLRLNGTSKSGYTIYRTFNTIYRPSSIDLHIYAPNADIIIGEENELSFEVINSGTVTESVEISIAGYIPFVESPLSSRHLLNASDKINGSFILLPTNNSHLGMFRYTVSISLASTSEVVQRISKTIVVTETMRPACEIITIDGTCDPPSLNTANCSKYKWNSEAWISFSGVKLESILSSGGLDTTVTHDDISNIDSGPLILNISGDCCMPSVTISVSDVDGYISQCQYELSDGKPVEPMEPVEVITDPVVKQQSDINNTVIIVSSLILVLFVLTLVGIITSYILSQQKRPKDIKGPNDTALQYSSENRLVEVIKLRPH